jgi:hypothetical protein
VQCCSLVGAVAHASPLDASLASAAAAAALDAEREALTHADPYAAPPMDPPARRRAEGAAGRGEGSVLPVLPLACCLALCACWACCLPE